jgi:flagellar biosynthetic protein FliP
VPAIALRAGRADCADFRPRRPCPFRTINIGVGQAKNPKEVVGALQIMLLLTVLTLAPTLLVMMTSFTRIMSCFRSCVPLWARSSTPPNQVLVGLALLLDVLRDEPGDPRRQRRRAPAVLEESNLAASRLGSGRAPLRTFMFKQTREKDIQLFYSISKEPRPGAGVTCRPTSSSRPS